MNLQNHNLPLVNLLFKIFCALAKTTMTKYKVLVDDNFHYMDDSERYPLGEYDTLEEAVKACKKIINKFLNETYKHGMTQEDLLGQYQLYGEDPFIVGGEGGVPFSAHDYAIKQSKIIWSRHNPQ